MTHDAYAKALRAEKDRIERELAHIGRKTGIPGDWEAIPEEANVSQADQNETADEMEEYETRIATAAVLEDRLAEVVAALLRIDAGTYGLCRMCNEKIEEDRLLANPAAQTCKAHLNA